MKAPVSGQTAYKRESGVNPFPEGPKCGSHCNKPELEWLQVDFQDNVDINEITKVTKDVGDILDLKLLEACMGAHSPRSPKRTPKDPDTASSLVLGIRAAEVLQMWLKSL